MRRLLKSKPVLIAGAAALTNKVMQKRSRRRRHNKLVRSLPFLAVAGAGIAVVKYFRDPLEGPARMDRVKGMIGRGGTSSEKMKDETWQPVHREPTIKIPENANASNGSPAPQPQI